MFIKYLCPTCNRYLELGDDISPSEARCPDCGGEVQKSTVKFVFNPKKAAGNVPSKRIAVGYLLALLIPLIGFVVGIYFLAKDEFRHGIGCMLVSLIGDGLWLAVMLS